MEALKRFTYRLTYDGTDITADISKHMLSVVYNDKVHGESDELTVTLEDVDAKWRGEWYPGKGAKLTFELGRGEMVNLGTFDIDELEQSGPPNVSTIRALATGIASSLRTAKNAGFENQSLADIANKVASDNGLTIEGEINDITFRRRTQRKETDLAFLKRLADESGNVFSIRDGVMFFSDRYGLEAADVVDSIDITDVSNYTMRDDSVQTGYSSATVEYFDPENDEVHRESITAADTGIDSDPNADELILRERVESKQHAEAKAKSGLYNLNSRQMKASLNGIEGRPWLLAGNNVDLTGFGEMSGTYHIESSTHKISRSEGWVVSLDLKRIRLATDDMKEPKKLRVKVDELVSYRQ